MAESRIQQRGLSPTNFMAKSMRTHYAKQMNQRKEAGQIGLSNLMGSPPGLVAGSKTLSDRPSTHGTNDMAHFSSLSQSQSLPQVYPCRWSWCRLTFDTNSRLVYHVIHDHVHTAVPVRRDDVPIYKRVEEGIGESLTLSGLGMSAPSHNTPSGSKPTAEENFVEAEPTSSLPSPPASSPTSLSFAACEDERNYPPDAASPTRYDAYSPSPEAPLHKSPPPLTLIHVVEDATAPETRQTPPTFASLCSPINPPFEEMYVDPPTPTFDSLVESAIGANRSQAEASPTGPSSSPQFHYGGNLGSQDSSTSSNSYDSVEKQLTQSMEVDHHNNLYADVIRGSLDSTAFGAASNQTPLQAAPIHVRQAWYGTRPAHNIASALVDGSRSTSGKGSGLRSAHATPSHLSNGDTRVEAHPGHAFRSGMLQITPAAPLLMGNSAYALQSQTQSSTQPGSQDNTLEYASYPPLQTQAPYQSQSLSQ